MAKNWISILYIVTINTIENRSIETAKIGRARSVNFSFDRTAGGNCCKEIELQLREKGTGNALQYAAISFMFISNPKLNADSFKKFFDY